MGISKRLLEQVLKTFKVESLFLWAFVLVLASMPSRPDLQVINLGRDTFGNPIFQAAL